MSPTRSSRARWWAARLLTTAGLLLMVGGAGLGLAGLQLRQEVVDIVPVPGVEPMERVAPLPPQGPVGAGLLLHSSCPSHCPVVLVTHDGVRYRLEEGASLDDSTLSPDGKLLVVQRHGQIWVRELTAVMNRPPLPLTSPAVSWAWSGRELLIRHERPGPDAYAALDLSTGKQREVPVPAGHEPVGLLPSGGALLAPLTEDGPVSRVELTVGDTGRTVALEAGNGSRGETGLLADGSHALRIHLRGEQIFAHVHTDRVSAVLRASLSGGGTAERLPLNAGEYPIGPDAHGFVVGDGPGSLFWIDSEDGRRPYPTESLSSHVRLAGQARH